MSRTHIIDLVGDEPVTARQLARAIGCSPNRIRNVMRESGVAYTEQRPRRYYAAAVTRR